MSETVELRTTDESSGDYRVFAAATVGGNQPVKGLAIHTDIVSRLDSAEYVEVEFAESGPEPLVLEPDKATSATVRMQSANGPAIRHVYLSPEFLQNLDASFEFEGEDTDLSAVPQIALSGIQPSSEESYEQDKDTRGSADEAADALFGDAESDSDESDETDADESDETDADESEETDADESEETDADESDETVEVADEAIGI
jgi:hypothetical protein